MAELRTILTEAKDVILISKEEFTFFYNQNPTISTFFVLPKIHKNKKTIPGRSIVSGNDNLTQNISMYVNEMLILFVTIFPSYLRDTKDTVIPLCEINVTPSTLIASLDVELLYTNIKHELGITAGKHFLNTKGTQLLIII